MSMTIMNKAWGCGKKQSIRHLYPRLTLIYFVLGIKKNFLFGKITSVFWPLFFNLHLGCQAHPSTSKHQYHGANRVQLVPLFFVPQIAIVIGGSCFSMTGCLYLLSGVYAGVICPPHFLLYESVLQQGHRRAENTMHFALLSCSSAASDQASYSTVPVIERSAR